MKTMLIMLPALLMAFIARTQVMITEIMYNPPEAGTDSLEFIELYNHSEHAVDLDGWSFSQGITMVFNESVILEAREYLVLAVSESAFKAVYGSDSRVIQWQGGALLNSGELLEITDREGNVVYSVFYSSGTNGWYAEADGNGASIELCNFDADPHQKDSWQPATNSLGIVINQRELFATAGRRNDVSCDGAVVIKINDFVFTPGDITVSAGQLVRWENQGGHHNVNGSQAVFPDNPDSFRSGEPQTGNWIYEFVFEKEGLYEYQCDPHLGLGMTGRIFVGEPDPYLTVTFSELRQNDENGIPALSGRKVRTTGIVHTPNFRPNSLEFFILNEENTGVSIFRASGNLGYTVREGDEIRVEGVLSEFRGLTQILAESITILSAGNDLVEPKVITALSEASEGSLVKFTGSLQDEGMWTNQGSGFNVNFVDGDGNIIDVRIVSATEIFGTEPQVYSSVTGIGSQFTSNAPFDTGYQLVPRYLRDFEISTGLSPVQTIDFEIFPNPLTDFFQISSEAGDCEYFILDFSGVEVTRGRSSLNESVNVTDLSPGGYILVIKKDTEYSIKKIIIQ